MLKIREGVTSPGPRADGMLKMRFYNSHHYML